MPLSPGEKGGLSPPRDTTAVRGKFFEEGGILGVKRTEGGLQRGVQGKKIP